MGIHPRYARLLVIQFSLDRTPTPVWVEHFLATAKELPWVEVHPPHVQGDKIILNPTDEEIEQEVAHIEERIQLTNQRWLTALERTNRKAATVDLESDHFSPDIRARIDAARQRTRSMSEAFSVQGFWRSDAWVTEDLMNLDGNAGE